MSPFDHGKSITETKVHALTTEHDIGQYNSFIVNRFLAYFPDCLLFANEINQHPDIPSNWKYDYLFYSVSQKKRYAKWVSAKKDDTIGIIMEYYKVSYPKALTYSKILTKPQIEIIREALQNLK